MKRLAKVIAVLAGMTLIAGCNNEVNDITVTEATDLVQTFFEDAEVITVCGFDTSGYSFVVCADGEITFVRVEVTEDDTPAIESVGTMDPPMMCYTSKTEVK